MDVCECCGEIGEHAGCTLLPGWTVCKWCVMAWFDTGLTNPEEIAIESQKWRTNG